MLQLNNVINELKRYNMDLRKELKEIVEQETVELFGINEDEFTDRLVEFVKDNFTEKVNNVVLTIR